MATSEFSIVSLNEVKSFLNIGSDTTDADAWLEAEIDRTSESLERYLDRKILARQFKKDFNGTDTEILYLENTPVLQVDSLYQDAMRTFDADTKVKVDDYSVFSDRIELFSGFFHLGVRTVRVDYAAGYGEIEIPFARTRVDFQEETGGDVLTVHLSGGRYTPTEIADFLEIELNSLGTHSRSIRFDYKARRFTITQTGGTLILVSSGTDFTASDSALPLMGFTESDYTSSPAIGEAVTLEIPGPLKMAILNLIALQYDKHSHGNHKSRGLRSIQVDDYRAEFDNGQGGNLSEVSGMPRDIESMLTPYRRAIYF